MKRVAFNGGELSPELALRSDMDVYMRGAQTLENFDVSQMGGIRRRRGMRPFADALEGSRIIPYIYSTDDRYIVEINSEKLRVFNTSGAVIPGLFAAGEVAGHKMGDNRLCSCSMADIYTFGRIAGKSAVAYLG